MAKRGRPPMPEQDLLSETLHVRVKRDVFDELCRRASAAGLSLRAYVRDLLGASVAGGISVTNTGVDQA